MALRDQPYIPLYVQDFLTDEKLIECSAKATGVYIRLMCIMHKSEEYGTILLKQKDKQSTNQIENFALKLVKQMPYSIDDIRAGINELVSEQVVVIEGDFLKQKRMIYDNSLSIKRANAGSKGGKFAQAKIKANSQANTENEIENESDIEDKLKRAFDEIYIDQQKIKWPHLDFDFEHRTFCEKVRGSPAEYQHRDTGSIRLAFQYQLRNAKNGKQKTNDVQDLKSRIKNL